MWYYDYFPWFPKDQYLRFNVTNPVKSKAQIFDERMLGKYDYRAIYSTRSGERLPCQWSSRRINNAS